MAFSQATGYPSASYEMENYIHGPIQALTSDQCVVVIAPEGGLQGELIGPDEVPKQSGRSTHLTG